MIGQDLTANLILSPDLALRVVTLLAMALALAAARRTLSVQGQATVGVDPGLHVGQAGTIVRTTARACIIETVDGRRREMPKDSVMTLRILNHSDAGKAHRTDAPFAMVCDTDITQVPAPVGAAAVTQPFRLTAPMSSACNRKRGGIGTCCSHPFVNLRQAAT